MPPQRSSTSTNKIRQLSSSISSERSLIDDGQGSLPEDFSSQDDYVTILGFGSLLSEKSSRSTFPDLKNFRLGKVNNYCRVFGHPASIFFSRDIANYDTKEMSSLSAEYRPDSGFICSVFEVSNENGAFMSKTQSDAKGSELVASMEFRKREEEFDIIMVPYEELEEHRYKSNDGSSFSGILCTRSTDENYLEQWGEERFDLNYKKYGIDTIWNWSKDSDLRPCGPYLRHCVLAAKNMGSECYNSFMDETYLVDRVTTIRDYLEQYPEVMDTLPPPEHANRYGG